MMTHRNYPLNALRAFEASARQLSFVKAGVELSVTPAALSHQVKKLEEYVGLPLFRRRQHGLELTDSGQLLASELREVFLRLDKAMEHLVESDSQSTVTLTVAPTFAVMWLIPRLHKFYSQHPETDVRIFTSLKLVDFQRDDFDAAIRLSNEKQVGLEMIKLFDETVIPMCSPSLLEGPNALTNLNDLCNHVLLHNHSMDYDPDAPTWKTWLDAAGVNGVDATHGMHFSLPDHGLQACMDGEGVVLGWRFLSKQMIADKRVAEPFNLALPLGSSFYLVYPEAYAHRANITLFRDWLLKEVQEDLSNDTAREVTTTD